MTKDLHCLLATVVFSLYGFGVLHTDVPPLPWLKPQLPGGDPTAWWENYTNLGNHPRAIFEEGYFMVLHICLQVT